MTSQEVSTLNAESKLKRQFETQIKSIKETSQVGTLTDRETGPEGEGNKHEIYHRLCDYLWWPSFFLIYLYRSRRTMSLVPIPLSALAQSIITGHYVSVTHHVICIYHFHFRMKLIVFNRTSFTTRIKQNFWKKRYVFYFSPACVNQKSCNVRVILFDSR